MNRRQLLKLGIPDTCVQVAIAAVQQAVSTGAVRGRGEVQSQLRQIAASPELFIGDANFNGLAQAIQAAGREHAARVDREFSYRTWGEQIDAASHQQMAAACRVPCAVAAALMPDAHVGYGLPIGGVLACEDAVIPYAVGVDIACRMKLSILDLPADATKTRFHACCDAIEKGTRFGVGCQYDRPQQHTVMDQDWTVSRIVREAKDKAWRQLGTSGSGNHFVEFGVVTLATADAELGLAAGEYLALLSHSGSRGTGAAVCSTYSGIARKQLVGRDQERFGQLGWLPLASQAGDEYWNSMNLMGDYASANHAVIHRNVTRSLGAEVVATVENHHNFAWLETHGDRNLVVHRKGATPAGQGVLGVIPGSMADPAFVVRGKGVAESLNSASHGAGRRMSRTAAKAKFNLQAVRGLLEKRGVHVMSAGADEVPGVYKNIVEVMQSQQDLVEVVARFDPKIVKMCGDGSKAED